MTPARTFGLVTVALASLLVLTTALARYYHDARLARAASLLDRGQALVDAGEVVSGLDQLRASLALNRGDNRAALVLATALLAADRPHEAETYLDEAIKADPTSGAANLARARVARALGSEETATYYHRAYFGSWENDLRRRRLDVGFELVAFLLGRGERERARAILAQIAADAAGDLAVTLKVALLLLDAGAPADALPLLRDVVARQPGEARGWSALAAAAFAVHDDQLAAQAGRRALDLDKNDEQAARIQRVASATLRMDPGAGRLRSTERMRRARALVERAAAALDDCAPQPAEQPPEGSAGAETTRGLDSRPGTAPDLEEVLDLATKLWRERIDRCPEGGGDDEALARVFDRIATGAAR